MLNKSDENHHTKENTWSNTSPHINSRVDIAPQNTTGTSSKNNDKETNRPMPIERTSYQASDVTPFVVHIQKETLTDNSDTTLHPVTFGRFLKIKAVKGIVNGSLKRIDRNCISLSFVNYTDANNFLNDESLITGKYKAFIPTFNVTRMGVVRGVPIDWTDEKIVSNICVPLRCGPIMKNWRIKRKVNTNNNTRDFVNTGSS